MAFWFRLTFYLGPIHVWVLITFSPIRSRRNLGGSHTSGWVKIERPNIDKQFTLGFAGNASTITRPDTVVKLLAGNNQWFRVNASLTLLHLPCQMSKLIPGSSNACIAACFVLLVLY